MDCTLFEITQIKMNMEENNDCVQIKKRTLVKLMSEYDSMIFANIMLNNK